jgi:hypothetical protein
MSRPAPSMAQLMLVTQLMTILKTLEEDCQMALNGSWDRSDDGFEAMLHNIRSGIALLEAPL